MRQVATRVLLALAGASLMALALWKADLAEILAGAGRLGWRLPAIVLASMTLTALTFSAGLALAAPEGERPAYPRLVRLFALTQGANETVTGTGELLKVRALLRELPADRALALMLRTHWLNGLTMPLLYAGAALAFRPPEGAARMWLVSGALALASATLLVGVLAMARRRVGRRFVARACRALVPAGDGDALAEMLAALSPFTARSLGAIVALAGPRLVNALEAWLVFRLVGTPIPVLWALAGQAAIELGGAALAAVPGQLGVAEGAAVLVYLPLGVPASAGLLLAAVRRARQAAWIAITGIAASAGRLPGAEAPLAREPVV